MACPHPTARERGGGNGFNPFGKDQKFPSFFRSWISTHIEQWNAQGLSVGCAELASLFEMLASQSAEELSDMQEDHAFRSLTLDLQALGAQVANSSEVPNTWKRFVEVGYAATDKALVRKVSPGEQADGDRESANKEKIEQWKRHWVGFAASIRAWSDIRNAAGVG